MSCFYVCDVCGKTISSQSTSRINIAIQKVGDQNKTIKHTCNTCFVKFIQPVLNGAKMRPSESINEPKSDEEQEKVEEKEAKVDTKETKQEEKVVTEEAKSEDTEVRTFDSPQVSRRSKYFTQERCFDIHRLIVINTEAKVICKAFEIEYQTMRNYINSFDWSVLTNYQPRNSVSELNRIATDYRKKLSTVKALVASCRWSLKDIASEVNMSERDVIIYYEDIPWFENNLFKNLKDEDRGFDLCHE